jgi:voltage-gated potassium channel
MTLITVLVGVAVREVVLVMVDVSIVFETVATRLDRLLMPVVAFLTFYGLLIVVFACLYRIADLTMSHPQFALHGVPYRVHFVDALYYSVVTITTVVFGDLLLLFGFSEIMRNAGPDSRIRERPTDRHVGHRDSSA